MVQKWSKKWKKCEVDPEIGKKKGCDAKVRNRNLKINGSINRMAQSEYGNMNIA